MIPSTSDRRSDHSSVRCGCRIKESHTGIALEERYATDCSTGEIAGSAAQVGLAAIKYPVPKYLKL